VLEKEKNEKIYKKPSNEKKILKGENNFLLFSLEFQTREKKKKKNDT